MTERFFNGDKLEIVLKPHDTEIENMVATARGLMLQKMDAWILDRLTVEQLENCVEQFKAEIRKRNKGES